MKERSKQKLEERVSADTTSPGFAKADLKRMYYLAENDEDLQLLNKMLKKYVKQTEKKHFTFGPSLMRLYHHLNKPDEALASIQDPDLVHAYDQMTSYTVAMDLLYENQRYHDVVMLYKAMLQRRFCDDTDSIHSHVPNYCLTLACAACYKLDTPETYATAVELLKDAIDKKARPVMRRAVAFTAALALKNDNAAGALELLRGIPSHRNYKAPRNLTVLCLTRLGRLHEVFSIMRHWPNVKHDSESKSTEFRFFQDVIAKVKRAVRKIKDDKKLRDGFDKTFKDLAQDRAIDPKTLKEDLERPIQNYNKLAELQGQDFRGRPPTTATCTAPEGVSEPLRHQRHRDQMNKAVETGDDKMLRHAIDQVFQAVDPDDAFGAQALNECWDRLIEASYIPPVSQGL
ncbi:pentatricopeptide repeat-containing protein 2, mitochondrial-like [Paramacrobiotus metropolitanus]|uniref:pentatricopeptide repeat-containing protein 2, mitochondrial-like n=1 Tax=Paramacrobiotus metropolitanus TaxID=2943436 RepID=UPI0024459692|nr:pentatricopeptide repeat-containing protein 2, mitochondrial-like [Paramacrobiotus metropolitanus]